MKIVYADRHVLHPTDRPLPGYGRSMPEVPERVERIRFALAAAGFPTPVAPTDFGLGPVDAVHSAGLLAHLRGGFAASRSGPDDVDPYIPHTFAVHGRRPAPTDFPAAFGAWAFDTGCPLFEGTWEASLNATNAALTAAEHVRITGDPAYALSRPPGHHAGPTFHGGFCYTNHVAIAARYLQQKDNAKVAILDIDYHHGNGTQEAFWTDPDVLFCSLHADPRVDYPFYWGAANELGEGPGEGLTHNVPLPHGTDDASYLRALDGVLRRITDFGPRYLVVSAGFDLMAGDPVPRNGGFRITPDGQRQIGGQIAGLRLPTVVVQEGGYNLARLGEYAVTLLRCFT